MTNKKRQKIILSIFDGWGHSDCEKYNAIKQANTPNYDLINSTYPKTLLKTSGADVGLPAGQMGNSEVGHTNIGAGRIVYSDLPRINKQFSENLLAENKALKRLLDYTKKSNGDIHIMGLVSKGGVHSHEDHILQVINYISRLGFRIQVHVITDGRDVGPKTALESINDFEKLLPSSAKIASLMGRYYAMDRDRRWDRTNLAYKAIIEGLGERFSSARQAIEKSYKTSIFDEFITPKLIGNYGGIVGNNSGLIAMNFRADRFRQILASILEPDFQFFRRSGKEKFGKALGLISYSKELDNVMETISRPVIINNGLGTLLAENKLCQLRLAETEKYAHVTYFFNGGDEEPLEKEDRILIPSPPIETYDKKPEMSCFEICNFLTEAIFNQHHDFILVNFANPDMVGHTGDFEATKKACEALDLCLGNILQAVESTDSVMFLTSDHGNAELMYDEELKMPHTRHTLNMVPFHIIGIDDNLRLRSIGRLCDIAPTVVDFLDIEKSIEMTGVSLLY